MSLDNCYAGGLTLDFFPSRELENVDPSNEEQYVLAQARNVLRILMMGWQKDWKKLLSWRAFNAVFVERDHQLTRAMRRGFQEGFDYVFEQLKSQKELSKEQIRQAQLYISNCLCLLPYGDITPYESFHIPQFVNGQWIKVEYKVTQIELTPTSGLKKLFLSDNDRVFAYGLTPVNNKDAEPHLVFMGTTYPAGQGFWQQVKTDLEDVETAGKELYRSGNKNVIRWAEKQDKKVHVCGTSLGGALSLIFACHRGDLISSVDALNPPGLYKGLRKSRYDNWDTLVAEGKAPEVRVQKQKNDPVSKFGEWKNEWIILEVDPPKELEGPNSVAAHALNYAGLPGTEFHRIDTEEDNRERKRRNFWLYILARSLFSYFVMQPFRYLVLPTVRFLWEHKLQLLFFIPLVAIFYMFPPLGVSLTITLLGASTLLLINAVISAAITSYFIDAVLRFIGDQVSGKSTTLLSRALDWFGQHPFLKTAAYFAIGASVVGLLAAAVFFPPFLPAVIPLIKPVIILSVLSIPLVISIAYKAVTNFMLLFGLKKPEPAACHDPALPRNKEMDIYANKQEGTFTMKEIHDYYHVTRCLLKNKPLIKAEDGSSTEVDLESGKPQKLSKRQILTKGISKENASTEVKWTVSKAKLFHIKETVNIYNKLSNQPQRLMDELHEEKENYRLGKNR
ncbi:hypothetical protein [Legionella genomosp. 1]|uniref:hypothetical protein n=1 Tax=Legionella genomosp. 1 TaxID=1093625 RepID=UPI001054CE30|nr:hypothetical protein [Legionella genomosp. 1]